jgi:hypothetical protein
LLAGLLRVVKRLGAVGVVLGADDLEALVELDVHLTAVAECDLDLVVALLVADLRARDLPAAGLLERGRAGPGEAGAGDRGVGRVVVTQDETAVSPPQ